MDAPVAERIGRNLFLVRRRVGYSQEEMAALCCLHRTEIGHLEHGRRTPRADTLIKVASVLEVRADALLRGVEWIAPGPLRPGGFVVQPLP
jgi:transcriptional regulator with XRE-family HTH domain